MKIDISPMPQGGFIVRGPTRHDGHALSVAVQGNGGTIADAWELFGRFLDENPKVEPELALPAPEAKS